jgi:hypothetical protein
VIDVNAAAASTVMALQHVLGRRRGQSICEGATLEGGGWANHFERPSLCMTERKITSAGNVSLIGVANIAAVAPSNNSQPGFCLNQTTTEAKIGCNVFNRVTSPGIPLTVRII